MLVGSFGRRFAANLVSQISRKEVVEVGEGARKKDLLVETPQTYIVSVDSLIPVSGLQAKVPTRNSYRCQLLRCIHVRSDTEDSNRSTEKG